MPDTQSSTRRALGRLDDLPRARLCHAPTPIEPMVNLGGDATRVLADEWTVVTADGSLSAHFEHTVAITEDGPQVLTAV